MFIGVAMIHCLSFSKLSLPPTLRHETFIDSVDHIQQKRCEDKKGLIEQYSSEKEVGIRKGNGGNENDQSSLHKYVKMPSNYKNKNIV